MDPADVVPYPLVLQHWRFFVYDNSIHRIVVIVNRKIKNNRKYITLPMFPLLPRAAEF